MEQADPIVNPTIFINSFEWREPITTATDLLVALVCLIGFIKYANYKGSKSYSFNFYKYYFFTFGIGMVCGAWLGHGLQAYLGLEYKKIGWALCLTANMFLALASLQQLMGIISSKFFLSIKLLLFTNYLLFITIILIPDYSAFSYAQVGSAIILMGFILPVQLFLFIKTKEKGSLIIVCAVLYGIIPGFVYNNQISLHRWFNYNDISHVLIAFFVGLMIWGTSRQTMLFEHEKTGLVLNFWD